MKFQPEARLGKDRNLLFADPSMAKMALCVKRHLASCFRWHDACTLVEAYGRKICSV